MSGVTATPPKPLCAHCLVPAVFWTPTYCCVCAGIIPWPGGGYKCSNAGCSMTVHRWIGHGEHENCRAEALLTHCPDNRVKKGSYKFGDLSMVRYLLCLDDSSTTTSTFTPPTPRPSRMTGTQPSKSRSSRGSLTSSENLENSTPSLKRSRGSPGYGVLTVVFVGHAVTC